MLPAHGWFHGPVDPYAPVVLQSTCDPTAKPGVEAFRKLVLDAVGGGAGSIDRACPPAGAKPSEHAEGRAWDWAVRADVPEDVARVDTVLAWLLAPDEMGNAHAMFRRAGLQYIIWNGQIWSVRTKEWQPYTGPSPHTDHVHFTFGWDGALGKTSLYQSGGVPTPGLPGSPPVELQKASPWGRVFAAASGVVIGFALVHWRQGRS